MRTRRVFTKEFKKNIVDELQTKSAAQISKEHEIHAMLIHRWKREYEQSPKLAFSGKGNIYKEEARIAQLERLVGQLYAENAFLKKTRIFLDQRRKEEKRTSS
jgi:transposase